MPEVATDRRHLLTAAELADHLGVSRAHIYNLMRRGLPSLKLGRCRRFDPDRVDTWLAEQSSEAA